jgi:hypothetical protein
MNAPLLEVLHSIIYVPHTLVLFIMIAFFKDVNNSDCVMLNDRIISD